MADPDQTLSALLDLVRRLPPTQIQHNVSTLCQLAPELADDLLGNVDQPLALLRDPSTGREFLGCDYNRDGDAFRSPWSNVYLLPNGSGSGSGSGPGSAVGEGDRETEGDDAGPTPSPPLRELEVQLNAAFDTYREMYYEGGAASAYLWDLDEAPASGREMAFAGVVLLKKTLPATDGTAPAGSWDSLHVFECQERGRAARYKLTSTVMLVLETGTAAAPSGSGVEGGEGKGSVKLSGSMTRQAEIDAPLTSTAGHVPNIGKMVEDMELKMRNLLSSVYFGKTRDVTNELRSQAGLAARSKEDMLRAELAGKLGARRQAA